MLVCVSYCSPPICCASCVCEQGSTVLDVNLSPETNVLTIKNAIEDDEGEYSVTLTNEMGSVTSTTTHVVVKDKPIVLRQPSRLFADPGSSVRPTTCKDGVFFFVVVTFDS